MMKGFDKWDMREYPLPPTIERGPIGRDCLRQRKHAWRAALKWVYNGLDYSEEHREIKDKIEQELEGGSNESNF